MGTINSAVNLISGALDADQEALDIISNNVANASTTGYTEEIANWQENPSISIGGTSYGDGATVTGATSQRDKVLDARLDQQQQLESASSTRLSALDDIQSLFTVDSGSSSSSSGDIGSDITTFFDSFSKLESDPSGTSYREAVLSAAKTLASDISSTADSLNSQRSAVDEEASGVASQVNALTTSIAELNRQIQAASPDGDAGTLEDQRQADISSLSKLVGINQVTTENNGLTITTTSGQVLVSEGQNFQLTTGNVDGVTDFFLGGTDITSDLASGGGQLAGYLTARDTDIPNALASLDQLAYSISTEVNSDNNAGVDGNGNTGAAVTGSTTGAMTLDIFSPPPTYASNQSTGGTDVTGAAAAMSVVMTDSSGIAAAATGEGTGDGSNATTMADLASSAFVDGATPSDYYSNFVSTLGSTVSEVETENTAQQASVSQLQTQVDSLSSVNLNDEASALTTMERSYQAASQTFSILDEIMSSALNLGEETTVAG